MTTDDTQTLTATTAAELYEAMLREDAPFILDVRNAADYERWHIEGRSGMAGLNIPYYEFLEDEAAALAMLPRARDVLVVCAKEGSSQYVAGLLQEHGIQASYLEGGITSWGHLYHTASIVDAPWGRITQIARPARSDVSFVLMSDGEAVVIDPLRHVEQYQRAFADTNARAVAILDTHVHADHISGGPALSASTGAPYFVHPYDAIHPIDMLPARIPFMPLADGQRLQVGQVRLTAIWYPGHTLGQVNFLAEAPDGGRYLFTGDGIFLRSFGRPDLGGQGESWTPMLYESMTRRLLPYLSGNTLILPSHFSTLDECDREGRCAATWDAVQRHNLALRHLASADDFAAFVLGNLPHFPPQYVEIKRVNIGLRAATEEQAEELELGKNICALAA